MNKYSLSPESIRLLKQIYSTLLLAQLNHDIWWFYKEHNNRNKYLKILNRHLHFFSTSIGAHFTTLVVLLYRLYEKRKDTINFCSLLNQLRADNQIDAAQIESATQQIANSTQTWKKLGILRNELFAHLTKEYGPEDIFKKANLAPEEIKLFLDNAIKLHGWFSHLMEQGEHLYLGAEKHIKDVLEILFVESKSESIE
jgi:hypothetical protein